VHFIKADPTCGAGVEAAIKALLGSVVYPSRKIHTVFGEPEGKGPICGAKQSSYEKVAYVRASP